MPNIRDFVNGRNIVILHSNIRVFYRLAADVDYFFVRECFARCHSEIRRTASPPLCTYSDVINIELSSVGRKSGGDIIK